MGYPWLFRLTFPKHIQEIVSLRWISDLLTQWAHLHILHSATSQSLLLLANLEHRAVSKSLPPKCLTLAWAISVHFRAVMCNCAPLRCGWREVWALLKLTNDGQLG